MAIFRKILFWLHLVAGCAAAIVIFAMSLSGAVLAFQRQLTNWAEVPVVTVPQPASTAPLESVVKSVESLGKGSPSQLTVYNDPTKPVVAGQGRQTLAYVNPYTAEVLPEAQSHKMREFLSFMMKLHRALGAEMRNAVARGIASAANLIFLILILSGLYLWLPTLYKTAQFKMRLWFRKGVRGKALEWNWHHVFGIWVLIPLFFVVLTGVILSYGWASKLLYTMTGSPVPALRHGPPGAQGGHGAPGGRGGQQGASQQNSGMQNHAQEANSVAAAAQAAKHPNGKDGSVPKADPSAKVNEAHRDRGQSGEQASMQEGRGAGENHGFGNGEGHGQGRGEGRGDWNGEGRSSRAVEDRGGHGQRASDEHGPRGQQVADAAQIAPVAATRAVKSTSGAAAKAEPAVAPAPSPLPAKSLSDLVQVAKLQVPAWKSIAIQGASTAAPTLNLAVDKSIGGQPEKVVTLTLDRTSGEVKSVKTFYDNSKGDQLRVWARMTHTGEEFGLIGEIIGSLTCIAAMILVWTGAALTIRRILATLKRRKLAAAKAGNEA